MVHMPTNLFFLSSVKPGGLKTTWLSGQRSLHADTSSRFIFQNALMLSECYYLFNGRLSIIRRNFQTLEVLLRTFWGACQGICSYLFTVDWFVLVVHTIRQIPFLLFQSSSNPLPIHAPQFYYFVKSCLWAYMLINHFGSRYTFVKNLRA